MYPAPSLLHIILSCALATLPLSTFVAIFFGNQNWPKTCHIFFGLGVWEHRTMKIKWGPATDLKPPGYSRHPAAA